MNESFLPRAHKMIYLNIKILNFDIYSDLGLTDPMMKESGRKSSNRQATQDGVDKILAQWARERPDLDVSPMGVIGRISRLERRLDPLLSAVFRQFGLERWSFDVLAALRRSGAPFELSPTQLFSSLMLTSGAITYRTDELVKARLVERVPDPHDRRGVRVRLTKLGLETIDRAVAAHVENERRTLEKLSSQEQEGLASLLRTFLLDLESKAGQ